MHADPVSPCNSKEVVVCLCSSPCSEKWLWKNHTCTLTPFLLRFCHLQQLAGVCYCVLGLWNETLVVPFEISSSGRWKIDKSMHMVNGKTKAGRFCVSLKSKLTSWVEHGAGPSWTSGRWWMFQSCRLSCRTRWVVSSCRVRDAVAGRPHRTVVVDLLSMIGVATVIFFTFPGNLLQTYGVFGWEPQSVAGIPGTTAPAVWL